MNRCIFAILVSCLLTFSCSNVKNNEKIKAIDLTQTLNEARKISLSDIANHVEYIRLETDKPSLISKDASFYANDSYIIAISFRRILLFNRKNGSFVREISNYGKNPGSYKSTLNVLPFDEEANTVYALSGNKKLEFSLDGSLSNQLKLPPNVYTTARIDNINHIGYVPNFSGSEKTKLVVFNVKGDIEKDFPNYQSAPTPTGFNIYKPNGWFYQYNKQLYFCELFNDTLFHISSEKITPRFLLYRGKYSPPYEKQTVGFPKSDYFMFKSIYESDKFLFYSFMYGEESYTSVYDKDLDEVMVGDYFASSGSGFKNDLDNLFPINMSSINSQNELIGFSEAYNVVEWLDENPNRSVDLQNILEISRSLNSMDNPVVIIANLKD
jgi:hypothetical protein